MARLRNMLLRAAVPVVSRVYSGVGSILMYHRLVDERRRRVGTPRLIEHTPQQFRAQIEGLRARGYTVVPLDELLEALPTRRRKLLALTFDDGYTDNLGVALPLLRELRAPFTVYLTSGFMDRTCVPWEHLLEEDLRASGDEASFAQEASRFAGEDAAVQKERALEKWGREKVAAACDRIFLSWSQVAELSRDPLVTIGAHSLTHPVLRALPEAQAAKEIRDCRAVIESHLGRAVHHFAYPYGAALQVGEREVRLARAAGYRSAVSTRVANVFPESDIHALPRIYGATAAELELALSGVVSAFRYRGRRVVTV